MTATVGFIGTGNMGAALARAVCKTVSPQQVLLANRTPAKAEALAEELGCAAGTNEEVARACRLIFLGVKPQVMGEMLASLTPVLKEREDCFVLVTMAAGLTCARIREMAGVDCPVIRVMPNTPAAIGEGVLQFCGLGTTEEDMASFRNLMAPAGLVDQVPDRLRPRSCRPVPGGPGGRRGGLRPAPGQGAGLRRPDAGRVGPDGAGDRRSPRCPEGRGVLPRGQHHPRGAGAGKGRSAGRRHGRGAGRL